MVMALSLHVMPQQVMACSQGTSAILTLGGVDPAAAATNVSYETVKGGVRRAPEQGRHPTASRPASPTP